MTHKYTFSFLSITSDKEKCIDQLPDISALHRTSQGRCRTSQVPDIPALRRTSQGRCRTSQVPDILGAGHPGLAPDISRQVPDISRQVPDIPAKRWTS